LLEDSLGGTIPSAWVAALGSGLRGMAPRGKDREITFLGEGAKELFEDSRVLNFLSFWRVAVPVVFAVLCGVFVLATVFLGTTEKNIAASSASVTSVGADTQKAMADLVAKAQIFNNSVVKIASVEASSSLRYATLNAIATAAAGTNIIITRVTLQSDTEPILVAGQAQSEDAILAFKSAIEQTPGFGTVNLPLAGIQGSGTSYSFSMTFSETGNGPVNSAP
jgi:hypothetical protein